MTINSPLMTVMTGAVRKAAKAIIRDFGEISQLQISRKGTADFATNADRKSEKILFEELKKARPAFGFLMEESGEVAGTGSDMQWVIDPIDGTNNFIHANPYFCISVALERVLADGRREGQAAVIYDVVQNDLYIAENGQGAYVNDKRLQVSQRKEPDTLMIATAFPRASHQHYDACISYLNQVTKQPFILRNNGATALDLAGVAAGRFDGAWFVGTKRWDIAAGLLLIKESRGWVDEIPGSPSMLVVSNGVIQDRLRSALAI